MSDKTTGIFVVLATVDHEASDPVRAFARKEDADALVKQCRDYEDAHQRSPEMGAPEEEWDAWLEANRAWEAAHPAAPFFRRDYCAVPVPFVPGGNLIAVPKRINLPDLSEELREFYPAMSAQSHAEEVKTYARAAIKRYLT